MNHTNIKNTGSEKLALAASSAGRRTDVEVSGSHDAFRGGGVPSPQP